MTPGDSDVMVKLKYSDSSGSSSSKMVRLKQNRLPGDEPVKKEMLSDMPS